MQHRPQTRTPARCSFGITLTQASSRILSCLEHLMHWKSAPSEKFPYWKENNFRRSWLNSVPSAPVTPPQLCWQSPLTGTEQERIKRTSDIDIVASPPQMTHDTNKNTLPAQLWAPVSKRVRGCLSGKAFFTPSADKTGEKGEKGPGECFPTQTQPCTQVF